MTNVGSRPDTYLKCLGFDYLAVQTFFYHIALQANINLCLFDMNNNLYLHVNNNLYLHVNNNLYLHVNNNLYLHVNNNLYLHVKLDVREQNQMII
jgi:hypothetical protein